MSEFEIAKFFGVRVFFALLAGLVMGIERTLSRRTVGIKTLVFVSMGSAIFTASSFYFSIKYPSVDPTRIIGQIVSGVGFLGAGVVFRNEKGVSGLTSAASIWVACGLGIMAGSGLFYIPFFASMTFVVVMLGLRKFESFISKFEKEKEEKDDV